MKAVHRILDLPPRWLAIIAVILFAIFESGLKDVLPFMSIEIYLLIRTVASCIFLCLAAGKFLGRRFSPVIQIIHPLKIPKILWVRAICWVGSLVAFAIALSVNTSQAFSYALFALHPLWTIIFSAWINNEKPSFKGQLTALMFTTVGAIMFSALGPNMPKINTACSFEPLPNVNMGVFSAIISLAAGLLFALSNIYLTIAKDRLKASSATVNFYSSYISIILIVPAIFALKILGTDKPFGFETLCFDYQNNISNSALLYFVFLCVVVTIATLFFSEAYNREKENKAAIATIDLSIIFFAALLDWKNENIDFSDSNSALVVGKCISLLLILVGSVMMVRQSEKENIIKDDIS